MSFDEESEFTSFIPGRDEVVEIARHLFVLALRESSAEFSQVSVEQIRSLIRDHLDASGCDISSDSHLMSAAIGALIVLQLQMQYSQIGTAAAMVPAAAINLIADPIDHNELQQFETIRQILEHNPVKQRWSLRKFLRSILHLGR